LIEESESSSEGSNEDENVLKEERLIKQAKNALKVDNVVNLIGLGGNSKNNNFNALNY